MATITMADGFNRADRHLMSKNFSAPRSKAKPASVTAKSPKARAIRVARTELQPWAMLANGPPWTNAGVPSSDWTRFGSRASLRIAPMRR